MCRFDGGGDGMRCLNDEEWENFKEHVKCRWIECVGGLGLAGNGCCSFRGDWDRIDCPKFVDEDVLIRQRREVPYF